MKRRLRILARDAYLAALRVRARIDLARGGARAHGLPFPLVVSLTSYPKRYPTLVPTLVSLLAQDVAPDRVVLWIAPDDMATLPAAVRRLEARGLEIRSADDLRSYKKIIPALAAFPDAAIVTADDDVHYPRDWLRGIVDAYDPAAREILGHRGHRLRREGQGLAPYLDWTFEVDERRRVPNLFLTGIGGIFYPPGIFHRDVSRVDRFMALCPSGDDIWLNWMARLTGAGVRKVGPKRRFHEWPGSQAAGLQQVNWIEGSANDTQLAAIVAAYGIPETIV